MPNQINSVTLIHGTYAKDAEWTHLNSPLANALRMRFGDKVKIEPAPPWSGLNNVTARKKAKEELINHLHKLQDRYRHKANYFVVAHSHGGNVALYAIRDAKLKYPVGIACLATPFLVTDFRILSDKKDIVEAITVLIYQFFISLALIIYGIVRLKSDIPTITSSDQIFTIPFKVFAPSSILEWITLVAGMVIAVSLGQLVTPWHKFAKQIRDELKLPWLPKFQLLIIRTTGDEASGLLASFHLLSQLSAYISQLMYRWTAALNQLPPHMNNYPWAALFIPIRVFISILFFLSILTLSAFILPFGWQLALTNLFLNTTAESTPLGSWETYLIAPKDLHKDNIKLQGFEHSKVHDSSYVHTIIADWIENITEDTQ
ncbi:MAG: hypothetical protein KKA54_00890 [Proteobacteria bacterium]|nr:hypothetical protein [Pseudomonadota bacterium]